MLSSTPTAGNKKGKRSLAAASKQGRKHRTTQSADAASAHAKNGLAAYQQQICDLEWTVSGLRERLHNLQQALDGVRHSRDYFTELFEHAPLGYVVHDGSGFIQEVNRAAAALLGMNPRLVRGASLGQFVPREEMEKWLDHLRRCLFSYHQSTSTELILRARDGRSTPVQMMTIAVKRSPTAQPMSFRTVLIDISSRWRAETALAQTQKEYHRLVDTIEGIVWEANAQTLQFTFVSQYAERLLGYPIAEWTRPGFWENRVYPDDRERVAVQISRAIRKQDDLRLDYRVLASDRRVVWLHDSITIGERGGRLMLRGVAIDATERHLAEDKLKQAYDLLEQRVADRTSQLRETAADLEAFSYSLSHDMRAPLRAMQGYATLLETQLGEKLDPQARDYLSRIMHSAERLDLLVQDVLNYSRVARAPVELKPVSLDAMMENILHEFPSLAQRRAQIEVQQPLLPVYGHEAFIGQALSNLLTNAVKFVPPERAPRVQVWTEPARRENGDQKWVRIWVQDNGLGIAPKDQSRIFRMFERVHPVERYEGTGIGLAIVQKAVERMGGRVGVQSSPGTGSKFWIELKEPNG